MNAMITFGLLILAVSVSATRVPYNLCWADAQCSSGCCFAYEWGNRCRPLANVSEICDLEGQGLANAVCGCEQGLTCERIDLAPWGSAAASFNTILENRQIGWCVEAESVVG